MYNNPQSEVETKSVYVPLCPEHEGFFGVRINLAWVCPVCGKPRGEIYPTASYDGSRRLGVDGWTNPCGHLDKYPDVIKEAAKNGLNPNLVKS